MPNIFRKTAGLGLVDLDDVAAAHALAVVLPHAQGRYLLCERFVLMSDIAAMMRWAHCDEAWLLKGLSQVWWRIWRSNAISGMWAAPEVRPHHALCQVVCCLQGDVPCTLGALRDAALLGNCGPVDRHWHHVVSSMEQTAFLGRPSLHTVLMG
jgi:uncharacterized protein YbjT (DUF2867 family)